MNLITAMEIQGNGDDIKCAGGGPSKDNGKYVGWIELWRNGDLHKPLLSTNPVFDTEEDAETYMKNLVAEVRKLDLSNGT